MLGQRIGPYEVVEKIGAGGMGEVYRARDPRLNRDVALKVLPPDVASDPDRVARFTREAQTLAALSHPNIATVFGVEQQDGVYGLVMELVDGPTLADRLKTGPIEWRDALTLARDLAEAVSAAHERGIIHRDLKPANIKVTSDGSIKVLDFGLAKLIAPAEAGRTRPVAEGPGLSPGMSNSPTLSFGATAAGMLLGTAPYMSPEQTRGSDVDRRSDVWAFGCVLYELLTGKQAFDGPTVSDTLAAVLRGEPDWQALPRDLPPSCARLLKRCLAKDRRARLSDLHDVALDIDDSLDMASAITVAHQPRRPIAWIPLALLALVVGIGVAVAIAPRLAPSPPPLEPVHMTITMPGGIELGGSSGSPFGMTFSPNGRQLYFQAGEIGKYPDLYRTSFDSFGVERLSDTNGLDFPIAGGDRSLFAIRGGQIFRVLFDGTTPTAIPGARGGRAVGAVDGRLFVSNGGHLSVVAEQGGTPTVVADEKLGLTHFQVTDRGSRIVATKIDTEEIVAFNPTDRTMTVITRGRAPTLTNSGVLVFFRDGGLWAGRFGTDGQLDGQPQPVINKVRFNNSTYAGWAHYAVSDSGHLAYVPELAPEARQLVWVTRGGATSPASSERSDFEMPRLSPDGAAVAVVEQNGISVLDLTRGSRLRFPSEGLLKRRPAWRPDNKTITYMGATDVWQQPIDGSAKPAPVITDEGTQFPDHWSPDGRTLLFNEGGATRNLFALTDGKRVPLFTTDASERSGRFHPSGEWFAYVSNESGRDEVYLRKWPSLDGKVPVSTAGGFGPVWSSDGKEIYYCDGTQMMAVRFDARLGRLARPEALFNVAPFDTDINLAAFDVAADGRFLMVQRDTERYSGEIRVILNWIEHVKAKLR